MRKDSLKGWLGKHRMAGILDKGSFVCHRKTDLQCAGHMLLRYEDNDFVQLAHRFGITLPLSGRELVFDTVEDCIRHHT